jgi:regulatory protein
VDDVRFARHYVDTRSARGRGPLRLRRDLAALGVARAVVDGAMADAFGPDGANAPSVEALARKRLAQLGSAVPAQVLRRRLLGYLARRGYGGHDIHELVGRLTGEAAPHPSPATE